VVEYIDVTTQRQSLSEITHLTTFLWQSRFPITLDILFALLSGLDQVKILLLEWASTHRTVGTRVAHNAELQAVFR
jgi:hypothetical protein